MGHGHVIRIRTAPARAAVAGPESRAGASIPLLPSTAQPDRVDGLDFLIGRGPMRSGPNHAAAPPRTPWPLIILVIMLWAPLVMAVSGMLG